jgi:hypothetical protein
VFWLSKSCGDVVLTISISCDQQCAQRASIVGRDVPATLVSLRLLYEGQSGFLRFVQDFSNGKKTFNVKDFPDAEAAKLRPYEVKTIHVYYQVDAPAPAKLLTLPPGAIIPSTIIKE